MVCIFGFVAERFRLTVDKPVFNRFAGIKFCRKPVPISFFYFSFHYYITVIPQRTFLAFDVAGKCQDDFIGIFLFISNIDNIAGTGIFFFYFISKNLLFRLFVSVYILGFNNFIADQA